MIQNAIIHCNPSAARTASPTVMDTQSAESTSGRYPGLLVVVDTTLVPGAGPSNVMSVEGYDPVSDKWYSILESDPITAVGTIVFRIHPALTQSNVLSDGVLAKGTLTKDAVPEKFKTTTQAVYAISKTVYTKAPQTAIVFSANHVVAAAKYGIVLIQIDGAGTITTKCPGATQTTPMAYASAVAALAALPLPDSGNVGLGYLTLDNSGSNGSNAGAWTANTDDLTDASDITAAAFVDATEMTLSPVNKLTVSDVLPLHWRVKMTAGNGNSATYSVGAQLLP